MSETEWLGIDEVLTLKLMTTIAPPRTIAPLQILSLDGISWEQYVTMSDCLVDQAGLRTAYDGKTFELMVTSTSHERYKKWLGRLFEMLTFELDIDIVCGGEMTFRREDLEKGLEPDQCYWVQHEPRMRHLEQWDPMIHPPADLVIEVDVTSTSVDREAIYISLGVPELWRFDGTSLQAYSISSESTYTPIDESLVVPGLKVASLLPFLTRLKSERENVILREFVDWINETLR